MSLSQALNQFAQNLGRYQKIGGAWYYLNPVTGARKTGWQYLNSNGGKTVYYGSDGKMVYGTQYIDGQKYYFDPVTGAKR